MVSIPSRRVGDDVIEAAKRLEEIVSIPSRRVGDGAEEVGSVVEAISFHPLKAGRRPERKNLRWR